jgi:hypothetical protein
VSHLINHHRAMVSTIDGVVVAYGAVADAVVATMLADLFVDRERLGQGIGRPLLTALFEGSTRRATFASDDPRALPLYVRAGMAARWVSLYLSGPSTAIEPQPDLDVDPATSGEIAELDRTWTGAFRPIDHAYWASQPEADAFVVSDAAGPVAAGYARARQITELRVCDRLVLRPDADPVAPVLEAYRRTGRGGGVRAIVPGPNPVLRALLERGFVIDDRDQYLASDDDIVDPIHLLPNPGML